MSQPNQLMTFKSSPMQRITISLAIALVLVLSGCGDHAPDNQEKFANSLKKAAAGDAAAQFNLGFMYDHGDGVPKDAA